MATKTPETIPAPAQRLMEVNPATLRLRDQAREDATPDEGLIASVRQHGILQPPIVEHKNGEYFILFGHRRVGASIAAGMEKITVIVRDMPDLDRDALTLEEQLVENERRKQLTSKDVAAGYSKLSLFGLRPEDIAASLGEKTDRVRAGLKIVGSAKAAALVESNPVIDFEQAAIIADFEDQPKLQNKLIETANTRPENFARDAAAARRERELTEVIDGMKATLAAKGVTVLQTVSAPSITYWGYDRGGRSLEKLLGYDGHPMTEATHASCPGHAAVIYASYDVESVAYGFVCDDWDANGHQLLVPTVLHHEPTPEELEARAERERKAEAEAERRRLQEANTTARRTWIHGMLTTGRLRPTASHFDIMATAFVRQMEAQEWAPVHLTLELLTGEPVAANYQDDTNEQALAAFVNDPGYPNLRVLIATAIATYEDGWLDAPEAAGYFAALEAWGYTLTDTDREHLAVGAASSAWREEEPTSDDSEDDE